MKKAPNTRGDISLSLKLMWHGRQTPSRGPRPGLTLDRVVAAAIALADREGLEALSMRKVAAELGVGTMSLYRYVPGKGELLALMLDQVQVSGEEHGPVAALGWRRAMELLAEGTYDLYRRHPWLLQVNQSRPLLGPNSLLGFEWALTAFDGLGLTDRERVSVIVTIDAYITGMARQRLLLEEAGEEYGLTDEEFWAAQTPILEEAARSGCYPHVFRLADDAFDFTQEHSLRFGLDRLLDGVESFVDSRRGAGG